MADVLPQEIISRVLDMLPLPTLLEVCNVSEKRLGEPGKAVRFSLPYEVRRRVDPHLFFGDMVLDTKGLMKVLLATDTMLCGSRASSYFNNDSCDRDSGWDFFCRGTALQFNMFSDWMVTQGMVECTDGAPLGIMEDPEASEDLFTAVSGVFTHRSRLVRVNIVHTMARNEIELLSWFDLSVNQCFLSGYGAFCMFPRATSTFEMLHWGFECSGNLRPNAGEGNSDFNMPRGREPRLVKRVGKYRRRGFRMAARSQCSEEFRPGTRRRLGEGHHLFQSFVPYHDCNGSKKACEYEIFKLSHVCWAVLGTGVTTTTSETFVRELDHTHPERAIFKYGCIRDCLTEAGLDPLILGTHVIRALAREKPGPREEYLGDLRRQCARYLHYLTMEHRNKWNHVSEAIGMIAFTKGVTSDEVHWVVGVVCRE